MDQSIGRELEQLEHVGRVSVRDRRAVHAGFGFGAIEPDPERIGRQDTAEQRQPLAGGHVATRLDDAWVRLKQRIDRE